MSWIQEGIKAGVIAGVTALVVLFWKNIRVLIKKAKKIIEAADKLEVLDTEVSILKSKQMADFHTGTNPVFIINTKGELIYANPSWADAFGWTNIKDAYGKGYLKCIPPEDVDDVEELSDRLQQHPSSYEGKVRFKHIRTDEIIYAICRTELIHDRKGNLIETIGRLSIIKT